MGLSAQRTLEERTDWGVDSAGEVSTELPVPSRIILGLALLNCLKILGCSPFIAGGLVVVFLFVPVD